MNRFHIYVFEIFINKTRLPMLCNILKFIYALFCITRPDVDNQTYFVFVLNVTMQTTK